MPKKLIRKLFIITIFVLFPALNVWAADVTAPVTTHTITPNSPNGKLNWYVTPVDISISSTDLDSGVKEIDYRIDGGTWQTVSYENTLNLAPNPSFEDYSAGSSVATLYWEKTTSDEFTSYMRDNTSTPTGFETTSIKISSTAPGWHGINHAASYAVATPLSNMSSSAWIKTENATTGAYIKAYAVSMDANNLPIFTLIGQSTLLTGTNNWTKVSYNFVVNNASAVGVYLDLGMDGLGSAWFDAVELTSSLQNRTYTFTVGTDSVGHVIEYYAVDRAGNIETYNCNINDNCIKFKQDITPPGNWHDSGAFRGLLGSDHELYVYTVVDDATSGLSTFTDRYTYHTDKNPGFGSFSNFLTCNSTWRPDVPIILISPPFVPGVHSAYLLTPKTDFCNNDWKTCKTVRFYSEDLAGNSSTKDYCINGPWLKFRGGGLSRSNQNISMISEPEEDNTDGVIEAGGNSINFFTSTSNWSVTSATTPTNYDYNGFKGILRTSAVSTSALSTTSGVYEVSGNLELKNQTIPNNFNSATFNQIYFINGDLKISNNISVATGSTALFIVKGKVEIAKAVDTLKIGIIADGDFYTAYDVTEGEGASTLSLNGIYSANKFYFQRTLQGTNNTKYPSESFVYEPKYVTNLRSYLGTNAIIWKSVE